VTINKECIYITIPSESRFQASKRRFDDSQRSINDYETLYRMLATRPLLEAEKILERIRNGSKVEDVIRGVRDGDLLLQMTLVPEKRYRYDFPDIRNMPPLFEDPNDPYIRSPLFSPPVSVLQNVDGSTSALLWPRQVYEIPYHTARILDSRISSVDAAYWTRVTDDNALVAQLISLYLSTDYVFYGTFHKDLFLDDLVGKRLRFCSPLLVNAICAAGLHSSDKQSNRAQWWRPNTLGYTFMAEAKRLYELEADEGRITTIQAASTLSQRLMMDGLDKVGMVYEIQITAMVEKVQLNSAPPPTTNGRLYLNLLTTAWGLFNWRTYAAFLTSSC
jgi:hypothetical protein